jgi:hypothetical protein
MLSQTRPASEPSTTSYIGLERWKKAKNMILSDRAIRKRLAELKNAKVNPELVLNHVVADVIMRQKSQRGRDVVGVMAACRRDLKRLAKRTRSLAEEIGRLQSDDKDTVLDLAQRYEARAREMGALVKSSAPRFRRDALVMLLSHVQQATGDAVRHLPVIAVILDSARELCGVRSNNDDSRDSLEKTLRRHVLPLLSKRDKTPLKIR